MEKLYPKCHPYWFEDGKKLKLNTIQILTHTAEGYIVPCCMCDCLDKSQLQNFGLFDEELKLKNVSSIKQILLSKQWITFHKMLVDEPQNAPKVCKKNCSVRIDSYIEDEQ